LRTPTASGSWLYELKTDETTANDIPSEEDQKSAGECDATTEYAESFDEALVLLVVPMVSVGTPRRGSRVPCAVLLAVKRMGGIDEETRWKRGLRILAER